MVIRIDNSVGDILEGIILLELKQIISDLLIPICSTRYLCTPYFFSPVRCKAFNLLVKALALSDITFNCHACSTTHGA